MIACVITGPSSCGKTTLIRHLAERGFVVVEECAREVLAEGTFHPNRDSFFFQQELARRQAMREREARASGAKIVFFDRGFFDQIPYCEKNGHNAPPEVDLNAQYDLVFYLERLPFFEADGVRVECSGEEASRLARQAVEEYRKRGIPIISIPAVLVSERAKIILEYLLMKKY